MVEKDEEKVEKKEEKKEEHKMEENVGKKKEVEKVREMEKVGERKEMEKVEKQKKVVKEKQDGVVEKLLDEMVNKSMESSREDDETGVVESVVEQLVSDTVDGSSSNHCLENPDHLAKEEVQKSQVLKEGEKPSISDSSELCTEKKGIAENPIDDASRDNDTVKEPEVNQTGETCKGSVEPTGSIKKSEDLLDKEKALANHVEVDSESKVNDSTEDSPSEKSETASAASKASSSNHNRSNSRGKKGKGDKNSPKKKKPNS